MSETGGPYLVNAFFCEKVLVEPDNVPSYIRVVDRWTISGPTPAMPMTIINTFLVVTFKSGMFRGAEELTITPYTPSGQPMQPIVAPLLFEGDNDRGSGLQGQIGFPVAETGTYWFEVKLGGMVFTKMPLRVVYLKVA